MSVWVLVFLVAAVKIPIAALMLWLPFRSDRARLADDGADGSSENDGDDGGIKAPPPGKPHEPHPRSPLGRTRQRGPHGAPASPARVRPPGVQRQRTTR